MKYINEKNYNNKSYRSIILIANSSWYLFHYRFLLIKKVKDKFLKTIVVAPDDEFSSKFKSLSKYIIWKLSRRNTLNIFSLFRPLVDLLRICKRVDPDLIHSHTLKSNLLVSIVAYLLNYRTVLSFTGLGTLSNKNGLVNIIFIVILKSIYFFSTLEKKRLVLWGKNYNRTIFIFQNIKDKSFFESLINLKDEKRQLRLIPGSGVPSIYVKSPTSDFVNKKITKPLDFCFLYCARLLKSKGIIDFLELSKKYKTAQFYVYGKIDQNSKDSLTSQDLLVFKKELKNVIFKDFRPNPLLNHLGDRAILVVPSKYGEGFPRAIAEAICLGYPVIASENSCASIFNKSQIFITKDCDTKSLIDAVKKIEKLIINDKLRDFLLSAKNFVEKEYSEERIVKDTLEVYKSILKNSK